MAKIIEQPINPKANFLSVAMSTVSLYAYLFYDEYSFSHQHIMQAHERMNDGSKSQAARTYVLITNDRRAKLCLDDHVKEWRDEQTEVSLHCIFQNAVQIGNVHVLEWARSNGFEFNEKCSIQLCFKDF